MKLLRETVRKLIIEEVCAGANKVIQQGLNALEENDLRVVVSILGTDGYDVELKAPDGKTVGVFEVSTSRVCPAYITAWTEVNLKYRFDGVGAVLYDIAVEVATKLGNYLTCDRGTVSPEARKMWKYYNASDEYEAFQMDTRDGAYTPEDNEDDCKQMIFYRSTEFSTKDDPASYKSEFMASPYTKAYKKKTITTIPCLGDRYSEVNG